MWTCICGRENGSDEEFCDCGRYWQKEFDMTTAQKYKHDCSVCVFKGHQIVNDRACDVWVHYYDKLQSMSDYDEGQSELILRHSSRDDDYSSYPSHVIRELEKKGYVPEDDKELKSFVGEIISLWQRVR